MLLLDRSFLEIRWQCGNFFITFINCFLFYPFHLAKKVVPVTVSPSAIPYQLKKSSHLQATVPYNKSTNATLHLSGYGTAKPLAASNYLVPYRVRSTYIQGQLLILLCGVSNQDRLDSLYRLPYRTYLFDGPDLDPDPLQSPQITDIVPLN
jgi:hypothetical protein